LPESHRAQLDGYLSECASRAPVFRWTPAANLHLTMRFLGHVDRAVAEGIADRLEGAELRALDLRLGEMGTFKRGRLARVVWIGLETGAAEISSLATRVEAGCIAAGLEPEGRKFNAHLTLARARPRDGAVLPALPPAPALQVWRADELILYESRLGRGGSVYEPLRRLRLS
jgi:RNA 2',3'-cyclic 3'-phosphodiesterase